MYKIFLSIAVIFFVPSLTFASQIVLKSGQTIDGKVTERTSDSIKIDSGLGVATTYYLDEIESIDGQPIEFPKPVVKPAPVKATVKKVQPPPSTLPPVTVAVNPSTMPVQKVPVEKPIMQEIVINSNQSVSQVETGPSQVTMVKQKNVSVRYKKTRKLTWVDYTLWLIFYIYFAVCLYRIAQKLGQGPAWMAWVPLLNIYLLYKVAGIPWLYWLGIPIGAFISCILIPVLFRSWLMAPFLIFVFALYTLGLHFATWYRVASVLNKPRWIGIVTGLPLVGLVSLGYLAFCKD